MSPRAVVTGGARARNLPLWGIMTQPARILLLQTGEAVPAVHADRGGFPALFRAGLSRAAPAEVIVLDLTQGAEHDPLPPLGGFAGVVMTGSPAMVGDDTGWMRLGARIIRHCIDVELPFLGVCFGHQLLGVALGAQVGPNPQGREMGTIEVTLHHRHEDVGADLHADPLLGALPNRFSAQVSHRDVILAPSPALQVVGSAAHDPCHVVKAGPCAWGVQFHPEFDLDVMRRYLDARRGVLDDARGSGATDQRLARAHDTPAAGSVLHQFVSLCASRQVNPAAQQRS